MHNIYAAHFNTRLIGISMYQPEKYNSRVPQDSNDDYFAI